mgnify:CR=1 FL=1
MQRPTPPAAVLWDMDGTLVDTEPYWIEVEHELAARHGGTWSHEQAMSLVGNDLLDSGRVLKEALGLTQDPAEVVEELLDGVIERVRREIPWRPGARELLADLGRAGVPCALVTMSYRRFVEPILEQLPERAFEVVVTGDQVSAGKPDPEAYLTAAHALELEPADCLAIEDSPTGSRSAETAGCTVLVVPNHVPVPEGPRRVFRESLVGLGVDDLGGLLLR